MELKVLPTYKNMESTCDMAIRQIEEKAYDSSLPEEGYTEVLFYGIAFYLTHRIKKAILTLTLMERKSIMNRTVFGVVDGEKEVSLFTLKNRNGMEITVSDLGAVLTRVIVPDQEGQPRDVVLG